MATYINYGEGEEDAVVQGAEWLQTVLSQRASDLGSAPKQDLEARALAFGEKFKELHATQKSAREYKYGPVFDFFVEHSEGLFAAIPEQRGEDRVKEVESFYALVLSMLQLLEETEHLDKATTRLCELFSKEAEQQPELRLRLLMMLYNTFNNPTFEFRYRIFKYVLDYSAKAGLFDQVLPYLDFLDSWMQDWDGYLTVDDKRQLYLDISRYMRDLGKRLEAFQHLKRYALFFQGCPVEQLNKPEVVQATIQLLKDAIQTPSVIQFDDILTYDTVKASAAKEAELIKLCNVFLSGSVEDLKAFQKKSPKVFETHGISFQEAVSKMQLLTLASLSLGRSEIGLIEVAKALEEPEENVERLVVRAISEGVIDGRIDQLHQKVLIKSAFQRKFEKEEWAFLDTKLTQWINNLEGVIKFQGEQKKLREGVLA